MTENNENCETCTHQGTCPSRNSGEAVTCEVDPGSKIKHKIIIASGKGGVGKSTVSVNLARALLLDGFKVGILDADITGPNIPKLLGIEEMPAASRQPPWLFSSPAATRLWCGGGR